MLHSMTYEPTITIYYNEEAGVVTTYRVYRLVGDIR